MRPSILPTAEPECHIRRANGWGIFQSYAPLRTLALIVIGGWGWYMAAMFRTSDWGYDNPARGVLTSLLSFGIFALPSAFLPLIGISWPRKFVAIAVLAFLCVLSVELFARGQEHLAIQRLGRQPTTDYTENRWWPFENHSLGFRQGQWWGCD